MRNFIPKYLILLLLGGNLHAQSFRLPLYEIFTGENNNVNPASVYSLVSSPSNSPNIVTINWEVPIHTAPTATWSLYQTNKTEIDWRRNPVTAGGYGYSTQFTPTGTITPGIIFGICGLIDGQQQWVFGAPSANASQLTSSVISTAQSYTTPFNLNITRTWNSGYDTINLNINIVATMNYTSTGNLVLRMVMVERNIDFPVSPGAGETHFEHVAIKSFPTLQTGTPLTGTWTVGQSMTFTMNCALPDYVRDKSEVMFVGFIQDDGNKKVIQAARTTTDPLPYDAKITRITMPNIACKYHMLTPTVTIKNVGTNAITAFTLTPFVNNQAANNFTWSGNLASGATLSLAINPFSSTAVTFPTSTFSCTIVSMNGVDHNPANNTWKKQFTVQNNSPFISLFPQYETVCPGGVISFTPMGGTSYTLYPGGITGSSFTVNPSATVTYTLTGENSMCLAGNTSTAVVTFTPAISVSLTASGSSVCAGGQISLTGQGAPVYTLQPGNLTGTSFNVNPIANTVYSLTGKTAGCPLSNIAQKTIQVFPRPFIGITSVTVCEGNKAQFHPAGGFSYTLQPGNFTGPFDPLLFSSTIYTLTGKSIAGCLSANSPTALATVKQLPLPQVGVTGGGISCAGETVTIIASGADSYEINQQSTGSVIFVNPTVTTTYTITGTNSLTGCYNTAVHTQSVDPCTLYKEDVKSSLEIYPVPSVQIVYVKNYTGAGAYMITGADGRQMLSGSLNTENNLIDISRLTPGIYHITFDQVIIKKIVVSP